MIVRIQRRENPYVQIDKRPLENPNLSWKAKGMLAYLLSRPDNWKISVKHLCTVSKDSIDSVKSTLQELKSAGHAELVTCRDEKTGRMTGKQWDVFEEPKITDSGVFPPTGKPSDGKTHPNNKEYNNKESEKEAVQAENDSDSRRPPKEEEPKVRESFNTGNPKDESQGAVPPPFPEHEMRRLVKKTLLKKPGRKRISGMIPDDRDVDTFLDDFCDKWIENGKTLTLDGSGGVMPGSELGVRNYFEEWASSPSKNSRKIVTVSCEKQSDEVDEQFAYFWERYGFKVNEGAARKAFAELSYEERREAYGKIKKYEEYVKLKGEEYKCHPSTYLKNKRFNDDFDTLIEMERKKSGEPKKGYVAGKSKVDEMRAWTQTTDAERARAEAKRKEHQNKKYSGKFG